MILGKIADENLRKAMIIFRGEPLSSILFRPLAGVIIVVIVGTLIYGLRKQRPSIV
jgi:TctA family transporter